MTRKKNETDLEPWEPEPDFTKDQIITWLYNRSDLKKIIDKIARTKYLQEELISELFLFICKMEPDVIIDLYQRQVIDFVILRWLSNQWNSSTSPFYNKIRKYEIGKAMTDEQAIKVREALYGHQTETSHLYADALDKAVKGLKSPGEYIYYHRDILLCHLELKTIKKVSEKLNIRPEYISAALMDAKVMLKGTISAEVQKYLDDRLNEYH